MRRSFLRLFLRFFLRLFLLLAGLSNGHVLNAQILKGMVLDEQSGQAIDFASVFFNGTFVGTTTGQDGSFELDISQYKNRPLSISAVGYYSHTVAEIDATEPLYVSLRPRIFELGEVTVTSKSLVRKRKACLRTFRREFIGSSGNAQKCYILNEEDITFNYGSDRDTLKAYASKPLRIMNLSLGYDITYHLERFEYRRKTSTTLYTGDIIFNRDLADNEEDKVKFKRRRSYAYRGSCSHFFRCLWADELAGSGFYIREARTGNRLAYADLVIQDRRGLKYLVARDDLDVDYYEHPSHMSFLNYKVYFEADGYYDPVAVIWSGTMAQQRIGDFLPYEYLPLE
jgi:hypothetical protein